MVVDTFDDDFAAMFGEDFLSNLSPRSNTSNNSFYNTTPGIEQPHILHQITPDDYSHFSNCPEIIMPHNASAEEATPVKMDKSSVLEDAIKYLKHLKERVKTLEEKTEKRGIESVVFIKKSQIFVEGEGEDEQSCSFDEQPLPEIEARACENHMLLRVHCENQKGILAKLLSKVETLNMIVVNTSATPFGNVALDITIIAELEKEFNLTGKEVVTALREALKPGGASTKISNNY
ncbi:transcription factor bhlh25 [Phtheirospermum japonicum]|uniref:Transcription factor bhlh25 n=1 Tax=Phtheirospermum japonicum TaxID=374723 RepID=A0A830C1E5_9LAMI|nr:transcription factor bhlh25 [Phtheirospermum japonicum]